MERQQFDDAKPIVNQLVNAETRLKEYKKGLNALSVERDEKCHLNCIVNYDSYDKNKAIWVDEEIIEYALKEALRLAEEEVTELRSKLESI